MKCIAYKPKCFKILKCNEATQHIRNFTINSVVYYLIVYIFFYFFLVKVNRIEMIVPIYRDEKAYSVKFRGMFFWYFNLFWGLKRHCHVISSYRMKI